MSGRGPAADNDFRFVCARRGSPTDVARWKPGDDVMQLWRRSRVDLERLRCSETESEPSSSRRSRAARNRSSRSESPRPRSDAELDSNCASSLLRELANLRISSSSFCSFLASFPSSFSTRCRDFSRSRGRPSTDADTPADGFRAAAAAAVLACGSVVVATICDLPRLWRIRSQSCTVRMNDFDKLDWSTESSTVTPGCRADVFDVELKLLPSPLSSVTTAEISNQSINESSQIHYHHHHHHSLYSVGPIKQKAKRGYSS